MLQRTKAHVRQPQGFIQAFSRSAQECYTHTFTKATTQNRDRDVGHTLRVRSCALPNQSR